MCHSSLSDTFGTSPAMNKIWLLFGGENRNGQLQANTSYFFSVIFCFWWPYRFWGIIRKNKLLLILGTFKSIQGPAP